MVFAITKKQKKFRLSSIHVFGHPAKIDKLLKISKNLNYP